MQLVASASLIVILILMDGGLLNWEVKYTEFLNTSGGLGRKYNF